MLIVRRVLVVVLALLLVVQVVRNAAVAALAPLRPASAARFWAGHPSVEIARGLAEIGTASRERRRIDPHVFRMFEDAAAKSPLSPEPFLVRGVRAQTAGNAEAAGAVQVDGVGGLHRRQAAEGAGHRAEDECRA